MPCEITHCYLLPGSGDSGTFLPLPQPKLVLDLATPKGCKAELTLWWIYPKIAYQLPAKYNQLSQK